MTERDYLDFDLLVQPGREGGYQARVLNAPVGETAPVSVVMPFSDMDLENFFLRIGRPRRMPARGGLQSVEANAVREFGSRLYDAVFHDEVRVALGASLDQAEGRGAGLRVRLRLAECPELADLPWEFLYDRDAHRFLALSEWTPLVRYLDLHSRVRPLAVQPPVRILVMMASPSDFPALDVEAEWDKLREALSDLELAGRVEVHRLADGTLGRLQRQLRKAEYHVFHFIGHGAYGNGVGDGLLALEGPLGRGELVSGDDLGTLLHDHRTLRLALLNSCEGARAGRTDPYAGTAQSLIRNGIPAVVAMQFEITDEAAITFSRSLYEAVADGYPLDASVAEARKAVRHHSNPVEWGTPVLYMRSPDGRIFDIDAVPSTDAKRNVVVLEPAGPAVPPRRVDDPDSSSALVATANRQRDDAEDPRGSAVGRPYVGGPPQGVAATVPVPNAKPSRSRKGILIGLLALVGVCAIAAFVFFSRGATPAPSAQPLIGPTGSASATSPPSPVQTVTVTTAPVRPSSAPGQPVVSSPTQSEAAAVVGSYFSKFNNGSLGPTDMGTLFTPTIQWYTKTVSRDELYSLLSQIDIAKQNQTFDQPVFHGFGGGTSYGGQPSSNIDYYVSYHKASGNGAVIVRYTLVKGVDGVCRIALVSESAA